MPMQMYEYNALTGVLVTSGIEEGVLELNLSLSGAGQVRLTTLQDPQIQPLAQIAAQERAGFRLTEIGASPIHVFAEAVDGVTPFSAASVANLIVQRRGSDDSHFIQNIPVAGAVKAPLVDIYRASDNAIYVVPVEQVQQQEGGIGWFMAQRTQLGQSLRPLQRRVVLDTSMSMAPYEAGVTRFVEFLQSLYEGEGQTLPVQRRSPISGVEHSVGHIGIPVADVSQTILISDLPSLKGQAPTIVVGNHDFPQSFFATSAPYFLVKNELLEQLQQPEETYTTQTFHLLNEVVTWMENLENGGIER